MTITEFLLARIEEDEWTARLVAEGPGEAHGEGYWPVRIGVNGEDATFAHVGANPARVLSECAAKRAIVEAHHINIYVGPKGEVPECNLDCRGNPCDTLQALAAVYASHEDYEQGWAL
ncbi:DUF6221 family protein [Arthrobacter bambusae]|uniref:DUF6221 family protein n=1 Tax=Arthrobacter bambusae TaxID=1338426 RepID=UPI00278B23A9|nr:DUF6221 family protein [Arthrobacter bambusae]MDQ0241191.1 hypothetical protein [Arthrobacter bambusae]